MPGIPNDPLKIQNQKSASEKKAQGPMKKAFNPLIKPPETNPEGNTLRVNRHHAKGPQNLLDVRGVSQRNRA